MAIAHVHVESWRSTYAGIVPTGYLATLTEADRALQWQDWLTGDVQIWVAELDGHIVGFIGGGPIWEPLAEYEAELYAIYLLADAQRQGIGTALLRRLAAMLVAEGFASLAVWVLEQNPAITFYERLGAARVGSESKQVEIGGVLLAEAALGWPDLTQLADPASTSGL